MRNWDYEEYEKEIEAKTKDMRSPKRRDKDIRERNPAEAEALANKIKESWQRDLDTGYLVEIPGGYRIDIFK